jgi:acylphosphatase
MTQAHILYSGTVQGVGFRYTVHRFAVELGVTGWVRNRRDGRVEILAEGEKRLIEDFIVRINDYFKGYIQDREVKYLETKCSFDDFQIVSTT